jgi:hypothetical protein
MKKYPAASNIALIEFRQAFRAGRSVTPIGERTVRAA